MSAAVPAAAANVASAQAGAQCYPDRRVYVVSAWPSGGNDRVRKVLQLRDRFQDIVLVAPGTPAGQDGDVVLVPKIVNPLGFLRILRLAKLKAALESYFYFPSVHILYVLRARRTLARMVADDLEQGRQVTVLTVAPPHALVMIGLYVKRRFPAIRWVIDWQDLWSHDENYFLKVPPLHRPRLLRLERRLLDQADLNVTTNARAADVLATQYAVSRERLLHIHHHYHAGDFRHLDTGAPEAHSQSTHRPVRIGFLGTLFKPPRVPGMDVVKHLQSLHAGGFPVELHVHGHVPEHMRAGLAGSPVVHLHGRVSHEEAINQLAGYDFLLLLLADLPNCRAVMSIKLPHYMMVGPPILAVVPGDSAIADIVTATGTGYVVPSEQDWRTGLERVLRDVQPGDARDRRRPEAIAEYSWDRLSERWIAALGPQ